MKRAALAWLKEKETVTLVADKKNYISRLDSKVFRSLLIFSFDKEVKLALKLAKLLQKDDVFAFGISQMSSESIKCRLSNLIFELFYEQKDVNLLFSAGLLSFTALEGDVLVQVTDNSLKILFFSMTTRVLREKTFQKINDGVKLKNFIR